MSARDPTPLLAEATKVYEPQRLIAILGLPKSGKTVIAALLHHSIVTKFLPEHETYRLRINSGVDFLKKTTLSLKKGEFPEKTPESEINKVEMILTQEVASGKPTELKLYDIAGEVYEKLFKNELPTPELLYRTLTHEKVKTEAFGPMSFVIFCRMYVFLIDCEQFENWDAISYENVKILNAILQWKRAISKATDDNINEPIAVILTKTDLLPETERLANVEDLLKKHMPDFFHQLKSVANGKVEFFKFHINVERGSDNKPVIIDAPITPEKTTQSTASQIATPAQQPSVDGSTSPDPNSVQAAATEPIAPSETIAEPTSVEPQIVHRYKVKIPLSYSDAEYARFILWIDQSIK